MYRKQPQLFQCLQTKFVSKYSLGKKSLVCELRQRNNQWVVVTR